MVTSVLVSLLHSLRFVARSRASLHVEILALRHQLAVVNRTRRPRLRLTSIDRLLWAWLSQTWRGWRSVLHIVKPETVIGWHRRGFRLFWAWKSRRRTGRPGVPADVRALIRELSEANPLWGATRIHGELQKLGVAVSQSTVAQYMRRHPRPPSQTWRSFLTNHANQIMTADLFVVPTVTFRLLFVLVILAHDRRRIVHAAVTAHPTAGWIAQQLRNAFPGDDVPRYLVYDRDSVRRGRDHPCRHAYRSRPDRIALSMAERVRRAPDWIDPPRVPRSRDRRQRGRLAPSPRVIRRVLHALAYAPRAGQRQPGASPRPIDLQRPDRADAGSGRPSPPLRARRRVAIRSGTCFPFALHPFRSTRRSTAPREASRLLRPPRRERPVANELHRADAEERPPHVSR